VRGLTRRLRSASAYVERRLLPPDPPFATPDRARALSLAPSGACFITGNGLAAHCRHVVNYDRPSVNERVENDWWFCKADFLEYFFRELAPDSPFVLFSHNSDRRIGRRLARHLRRRQLLAWFAANVSVARPRLFAIPLGVANPIWPHGDVDTLKAVQLESIPKTKLFDVAFNVETNRRERLYCLKETRLEPDAPVGFREYLERLAGSYFCLAPRGNGIDTHRTWEALYVGTIPVVTRSVLTDQHPGLPMVVLGDWSEFRSIDFGPDLYARLWGDWRADGLRLDAYLQGVDRILAGLQDRPAA
jgi:hypothetical protein